MLVLVFVPLLLLVGPSSSSPVVAPIRCGPCTPQQLSSCPPVAPSCPEVLREPGCGCCPACALLSGEACGVHTGPCGSGLRCVPRPGDPQPLHSLTRGHGVCTQLEEVDQDQNQEMLKHNTVPTEESEQDTLQALLGLTEPHETIRARANAIRNKLIQLGPCHTQLHSALDTIAASQQALGEKFSTFYLPNCDKHGFYKPRQCETSLVGAPPRCWCVSSWNGRRISGSGTGDDLCQQEVTH